MSEAEGGHPELGRLAALIGEWTGHGEGRWDGDPFTYSETAVYTATGKPFLAYQQRTRSPAGTPMHSETGFWRLSGAGVEAVLAHGTGVAEIEAGAWDGNRLHMRSTWLQVTPTAKPVAALERTIEVEGGLLRYELRMAVDAGSLRWHLSAELRRST